MNIDIYTFVVALGIVYSIQIVIFFHEYLYHRNLKGPGWWLLWSASSLVGYLAMLARKVNSIEQIAILIQNVMFVLGAIFLYVGIMRFLGKKARLKLQIMLILLFVLPLSYYIFFEDNIQIRTIIIWTSVIVCGSIAVYDLSRIKEKSVRMALNLCTIVLLSHVLFAVTKVAMLLTVSKIESFNSRDILNSATFIEIMVISVFLTYSLIMMINQHLRYEIDRAKDHIEIIFNTTPDAIIISNLSNGLISSANQRFYDVSGYAPGEVIGKTTTELNFWKDIEHRQDFIQLMQMQGYCTNFETELRKKDQTIVPSLISSQLIDIHETQHLISIIRDITILKEREKEILSQNIQLKLTNTEKDKFFSIMAHDLKGPFSSFLGLTEIMAEEIPQMPLSQVIKLAETMRDSARNIFGLLNNLLEWSLIKQGTSNFDPIHSSLLAGISESIKIYTEIGLGKGITLISQVSPDIMVYADPNMLLSLVRNLLSNAIKYTPKGGSVTVAAETLEDQSCLISISDTGIGISKGMQELLFRIDAHTSRPGTNGELSCGLGLLLCKEFVDRHHGEIWVKSKEGEGSTFFVRLRSA